MLTDGITIRSSEEGFSVTAKYNDRKDTYFFSGHIGAAMALDDAFARIRGAITDIARLTEGRGRG
jgi:hypothetical protein